MFDELIWGQVPKWAMRTALIIVEQPGFKDVLGLGEQDELVYVQTLVSQPPSGGFLSPVACSGITRSAGGTSQAHGGIRLPVNDSLVAHVTAQSWLWLGC